MERSMDAGVGLMDTAVGKQDRRATGFDEMEVNPLWSGIDLKKKKNRYGFFVRDTWRTAAFVRDDRQDHNPKELRTLRYGDRLTNHPIIWRSFATFPPVDRLSTLGSTTIEPENPTVSLSRTSWRVCSTGMYLYSILSLSSNLVHRCRQQPSFLLYSQQKLQEPYGRYQIRTTKQGDSCNPERLVA